MTIGGMPYVELASLSSTDPSAMGPCRFGALTPARIPPEGGPEGPPLLALSSTAICDLQSLDCAPGEQAGVFKLNSLPIPKVLEISQFNCTL